MKLTRRQLRKLIIEAIEPKLSNLTEGTKQCVGDMDPAVIALKQKITSAGFKIEEGEFDLAGQENDAMKFLGAALFTIGINNAAIDLKRIKTIVKNVEKKNRAVKFAWVSYTGAMGEPGPCGYKPIVPTVDYISVYATYTDPENYVVPTDAEVFKDLSVDLALAKSLGYGC
jgi:hypothetical protein